MSFDHAVTVRCLADAPTSDAGVPAIANGPSLIRRLDREDPGYKS